MLHAGDVTLDLGEVRLMVGATDLSEALPLPAIRVLGVLLWRPGMLFSASTIGTATLLGVDSVITLVCRLRRVLREADSEATVRTVKGLEDGPHYAIEVPRGRV